MRSIQEGLRMVCRQRFFFEWKEAMTQMSQGGSKEKDAVVLHIDQYGISEQLDRAIEESLALTFEQYMLDKNKKSDFDVLLSNYQQNLVSNA